MKGREHFYLIYSILILLLLCACAPSINLRESSSDTSTSLSEPTTMQYIGHSSFLLTSPDGTRIIMDPYKFNEAPREIRQYPKNLSADYVTISHFHPDHSNVKGVQGNPKTFIQSGTYQAGDVKITGFESDHGLVNGKPHGENTIFVFEIGDAKIVHMGAGGIISQEDILVAIEGADIITLDADGSDAHPAVEMLDQLKQSQVRTIILTHYSFSEDNRYYGAPTIDKFLKMLPDDQVVIRDDGSEIVVTDNLPEQVLVLTPLALSVQD